MLEHHFILTLFGNRANTVLVFNTMIQYTLVVYFSCTVIGCYGFRLCDLDLLPVQDHFNTKLVSLIYNLIELSWQFFFHAAHTYGKKCKCSTCMHITIFVCLFVCLSHIISRWTFYPAILGNSHYSNKYTIQKRLADVRNRKTKHSAMSIVSNITSKVYRSRSCSKPLTLIFDVLHSIHWANRASMQWAVNTCFSLSLVRGKLVRSGAKRIGLGDEHVALYGVDSVHSVERNHLHVIHRPQVRVVTNYVVDMSLCNFHIFHYVKFWAGWRYHETSVMVIGI